MYSKRILTVAVLAIGIIFSCTTQAPAADSYKFVLPILDELSGTGMNSMIEDIIETISGEIGIAAEFDTRVFKRGTLTYLMMEKAFKEEGADFGLIFGEDYARIIRQSESDPIFHPIAMITFDRKRSVSMCLFTRKDSTIKSITDLKDQTVGTTYPQPLRFFLHEDAGFDGSVYDYFGEVKRISDVDTNSIIDSLVSGEIDGFVSNEASYRMSKKGPNAAKVKKSECKEFVANFIIVASKDVPDDVALKVRKLFLSAHQNKSFQKFGFLFIHINGNFVAVEDKDLKCTYEIMDLWDKFDWEADSFKLNGTTDPRKK